jgi:hypothetical protein
MLGELAVFQSVRMTVERTEFWQFGDQSPADCLSDGGRKSVRSSLFVGAMVAARYNPQLKHFRANSSPPASRSSSLSSPSPAS